MIDALLTALGFLTILPIRSKKEIRVEGLGGSAGWFPYIGALIGALAALALFGFSIIFPRLLAAALAAAVWIALTGGLHLDGLADCFDGLLYPGALEKRLEIMKDPRHGTFAGLGLALTILVKIIALYSLPEGMAWLVLPLASATARWLLLPAGKQPNARPGGLGSMFSAGLQNSAFLWGALPMAALTALIGWQALAVVAAAHALAWLVFRLARARLGGMTGDVYGLLVEMSELVILTGFCVKGL
jgi:adenosylcobinamide-GDP ribazoletransferase